MKYLFFRQLDYLMLHSDFNNQVVALSKYSFISQYVKIILFFCLFLRYKYFTILLQILFH